MILLDTGPLVALCDRRDGQHTAAVRELGALSGEALATCEAVLAEVHFHLRRPAQRQRVRELTKGLRVEVLPERKASPLWPAVLEWLQKYDEYQPDWADACIAVLSGLNPQLRVWTFDREFHTTWKRPDGSAIPLVARPRPRDWGTYPESASVASDDFMSNVDDLPVQERKSKVDG
ncbi:MAG: PIN domain-containing protein [Vicinamibacterales bacterium]